MVISRRVHDLLEFRVGYDNDNHMLLILKGLVAFFNLSGYSMVPRVILQRISVNNVIIASQTESNLQIVKIFS